MAQIYGQIESLKQIRNILDSKGIDRFNSLHEFDAFLENYESEKIAVYQYFEKELNIEIFLLEEDIKYKYISIEKTKSESNERLETKNNLTHERSVFYKKINKNTFLSKQYTRFALKLLSAKIKFIRYYHKLTSSYSINKIAKQIKKDRELLNKYIENKNSIIEERSKAKIEELEITKEVVLGLNLLIAGAVGENLVVREIEKLSDDYILINDFSMRFTPPIYNRRNNDRIFSIQIDHLLISKAGLFILETKNWSKESIQSLDIRSPIKQVSRSNYALFVLLNSRNSNRQINLNTHHWGDKQISIRSVVVMINQKPDVKFKHVKVKALNELNSYINFFDPIFTDEEFSTIKDEIMEMNNTNS